ncbi:HAD family hydrolase [Ktedonosporobacter rubrisoli]|uniref:HAD family hydrolase n=1 Tax=Ktedonosporobacter rubrisoli TaxID=2509675 RepID=A0A4P6JJ15_KTERU|nr:HAD-IC family P-type ATPase [Ktedonosporobacter rubrisoli]QBD75003.1 HAD family hydrolase [Ktedonosporobacter rubrisoli]
MSLAISSEPQVLHSITGRLRVHLPGWEGGGKRSVESELRQLQGVQRAQANALTGNVLILFDPTQTSEQQLLKALGRFELDQPDDTLNSEPALPPAIREKQGQMIRARIAVRGLDRDPHLAKRVVEHLESRYPGLRARANILTGRVLVEFHEHHAELEDLLAEVAGLELPELPGEDHPAHPLDPGPFLQGATRSIGAILGLGLLATRRLIGAQEPLPGAGAALHVSSMIGIVQSIPLVRYGLRKLLGRTVADLLMNVPAIVSLTLAGSPLGLAVAGTESLRLVTEVYARQQAWRRQEERETSAPSAQPDTVIHLDQGERLPLAARILKGTGTASGLDGMPMPVTEGSLIPAGARLYGGPFVCQVKHEATFQAFTPEPRPAPVRSTLFDRYQQFLGPISLLYATGAALLTRSFSSTLTALLLVNPRTALIGQDSADLNTNARVLRAGATIVGTRKGRAIRLPHLLLMDNARLLTSGLELTIVLPLNEGADAADLLELAGSISAAAGSPWGGVFKGARKVEAAEGNFDGTVATALVGQTRYTLGPSEDWCSLPEATRLRQSGNYILVLRRDREQQPLGLLALRPKLAVGLQELVQTCHRYGVELAILGKGDQLAVRALAHRANVAVLECEEAVHIIRTRQQDGAFVAFVSDNASAAPGFAACDLAIGLNEGRSRLPARTDLLAPDLGAVVAIIEAASQREATVRDSIILSIVSNAVGAIWGIRGMPGIEQATRVVYTTALASLADGWLRLRGGRRQGSSIAHLVDPHPERWGQQEQAQVLQSLNTSEEGLNSEEAARRRGQSITSIKQHSGFSALFEQVRSPLIGILALGAGLSLFLGATADVLIIGATILANVAVGVWQEYRANQVSQALQNMRISTANVLRDHKAMEIPAADLVVGDILLLQSGDRIGADARLLRAHGLEVDESALTGESLPISKDPDGPTAASRVVLAGSDVTTGRGLAVVTAVASQTRMGATAAAMTTRESETSPLDTRLARLLRLIIPLSIGGGGLIILTGLLRRLPIGILLSTGATLALTALPEGLPILTRVSEAGVAKRLASRNAAVRRLSAIEALGRVDVACTDKTGTMTEGHLTLSLIADSEQEVSLPGTIPEALRSVLLTGALACPHPDAPDARAHLTDIAIVRAASMAGLSEQIQVTHEAELSFDPVRSFHATVAQGRLCIKGAPEALVAYCTAIRRNHEIFPLDEAAQRELLVRATSLAKRGLRVLMVAEGPADAALDEPRGLVALGFLGISDPLRPTVKASVRRCREAGVRVMMITGDHPATARAIGIEAGLLNGKEEVLTAADLADLDNGELERRLEQAAVIARATPLDKLRIIEGLQRRGHTIAMTGDGVNDAPALRLANVGVAMGRGGTEVARQTADVVLTDDNFSTLVEALVEGRSFWRNIRRALGLLLGGNLGELGLVVGASLLGLSFPLTSSQILTMNAITDILPATAVALQQPEHRSLAGLDREGARALDKPLRNDIVRRALSTALPSLIAYGITLGSGTLSQARSVAFASVIVTQLAQTLDAGRTEGGLTRPVLLAVGGSLGVLLATLTVPPLRNFLGLVMPTLPGWGLIGGGIILALAMSHIFARIEKATSSQHLAVPAPQPLLAALSTGK